MKALILALLLAAAPIFPFASYDKIDASDMIPACEGRAAIVRIDAEWQALSDITKVDSRDMFLHSTAGQPDYVYLTMGTKDGRIKVLKVLSFVEAQKLYP